MQTITLISTMHQEDGKCNAHELSEIIAQLSPEVIFVEALEETYSEYKRLLFSSFGVYDKKLEIKALQLYGQHSPFEYVPVLDEGLSDAFEKKFSKFENIAEHNMLIDIFIDFARNKGFEFLNSFESTKLQEEMRQIEALYLRDSEIEISFNESIDSYENNMIQNIYEYCKDNKFKTAVFLCGVAHRKSIMTRFADNVMNKELNINWQFYTGG
jgi:hypothetical protein